MSRGIATTIVAKAKASIDQVYAHWNQQYGAAPFVQVLNSGCFPDTKHVTGTNRCDIAAVYDLRPTIL